VLPGGILIDCVEQGGCCARAAPSRRDEEPGDTERFGCRPLQRLLEFRAAVSGLHRDVADNGAASDGNPRGSERRVEQPVAADVFWHHRVLVQLVHFGENRDKRVGIRCRSSAHGNGRSSERSRGRVGD
jgi:hypothetical protein